MSIYTVLVLAIQSTYSSSCPGNMQIANRSNSFAQSLNRFKKLNQWGSSRTVRPTFVKNRIGLLIQFIQPGVVRRTGSRHNWFILSLALKCHPKITIVFIFIFDSSFLTLLNHVPFWWTIRPSIIPFFFTPWVPNFNQTFKGSIFQFHFINKQKTFYWFILIINASSLLEKLYLTLRPSLDL